MLGTAAMLHPAMSAAAQAYHRFKGLRPWAHLRRAFRAGSISANRMSASNRADKPANSEKRGRRPSRIRKKKSHGHAIKSPKTATPLRAADVDVAEAGHE